jgi:hypothetical protein
LSYIPSTIKQARRDMLRSKKNWEIPFFNFVDDVRYCKDISRLLPEPLKLSNPRFDALLASTVEALCAELRLKTPAWVWEVPGLEEPWFVTGIENLKAMAIVESPVFFRRRLIFVLENFLSRV